MKKMMRKVLATVLILIFAVIVITDLKLENDRELEIQRALAEDIQSTILSSPELPLDMLEREAQLRGAKIILKGKDRSYELGEAAPDYKLEGTLDAFYSELNQREYAILREELLAKQGELILLIPVNSGLKKSLLNKWFVLLVMMLLLFFLLVELLSRKPLRWLALMREHSFALRRREFSHSLQLGSMTEMKDLSNIFNDTSAQLAKDFQRMHRRNLELSGIFRSIQTGMVALDLEGRIIQVNEASGQMLGFRSERAIGKLFSSYIRRPEVDELLERMERPGSNYQVMSQTLHKDGKIIRLTATPLLDEREKYGIALILEDITQNEKLQQMRSEFAANVSHELRTPLTSIKGFAETLLEQDVDHETRRRFLGIIHEEVERMQLLISDLFLISKLEKEDQSLKRELFSPEEVLQQALEHLEHILSLYPKLRIQRKSQESQVQLFGNRQLFRQLILNLAENSIKYSKPEGGVILFESQVKKGEWILQLSDQGIGIAEEDLPRIFERFYRVDSARSTTVEGTGLGLSIVKHILISLGGSIQVDSKLNVGTTFRIKIPIQQ